MPTRNAAQLKRKLASERIGYREFFATQAGKAVVADLAEFCHFYTTTHVIHDPFGSAQLEGRRQVFLRLIGKAGLKVEEIESIVEMAYMGEGE